MRILYIVKGINGHTGVKSKVNDMADAWRRLENEVSVYDSYKYIKPGRQLIIDKILFKVKKLLSYFYDKRLSRHIIQYNPDVIYWRFGPIPLLQSFNSNIKIVIESNTNLEVERNTRDLFSKIGIYLYLKKFLKVGIGVVGVTEDCLRGFESLPRKTVIGNGLKFRSNFYRRVVDSRSPVQGRVSVFVGMRGCAWHGIDKLLALAREIPNIDFKVVGYNMADLCSVGGSVPKNVKALGTLEGDALSEVLENADIAFGSLAMERAGMQTSSSLKNRTYLQHGLPIIMQGKDTDLDSLPGVFSLPLNFSLDEAREAISVALNFKFDESHTMLIRKRIDSMEIERRRVIFFKDLFEH